MNTSSLTGVVLAVAAVVWLAFFVPAWVKRDQTVGEAREAAREIKQRVKNEFKVRTLSHSSLVRKAARLAQVRRVLGAVTLLGSVAGLLSAIGFSKLWPVTAVSVVVAGLSLVANRRLANIQLSQVPAPRAVRPANYAELYRAAQTFAEKAGAADVAPPAAEGWMPRVMPAPMHLGHVGKLEQPVLAEVVALAPAENEIAVSGSNLDDILRRRRAI